MLISDAPPWVMNGNGMPVMGMIPITIPTLTKSWNTIIEPSPAANIVPNGSLDLQPLAMTRQINAMNNPMTTMPPMNPSSSARIAKTKSVV